MNSSQSCIYVSFSFITCYLKSCPHLPTHPPLPPPVRFRTEASKEKENPGLDRDLHRLRRGRGDLVPEQALPAPDVSHLSQTHRDPRQLPQPLAAGLLQQDQAERGGRAGQSEEETVHLQLERNREGSPSQKSTSVLRFPQQRHAERRMETGDE